MLLLPTRFPIGAHLLDSSLAVALRTLLPTGVHHLAHLLLTACLTFRSLLLSAIFLHPLGLTLLHLLCSLLAACIHFVHPLLTPAIILLAHLLHHLLALLLLRTFLTLRTLLPLRALLLLLRAFLPLRTFLTLWRCGLPFGSASSTLALNPLFTTAATITSAVSTAVAPALSLAEKIAVGTNQCN